MPDISQNAGGKTQAAPTFATRLAALALAAVAIVGPATQGRAHDPHHTFVPADTIEWGAAPPSLPAGAQPAALLGSPAKEGPFVLRLKFRAGFVIPPHWHTKDELVTVISGAFAVGAGEVLDRSTRALPAASFVHLPAGMAHFAFTGGDDRADQRHGALRYRLHRPGRRPAHRGSGGRRGLRPNTGVTR